MSRISQVDTCHGLPQSMPTSRRSHNRCLLMVWRTNSPLELLTRAPYTCFHSQVHLAANGKYPSAPTRQPSTSRHFAVLAGRKKNTAIEIPNVLIWLPRWISLRLGPLLESVGKGLTVSAYFDVICHRSDHLLSRGLP